MVSYGVEKILRKKMKQEWVHTLVTPTAVMWALEYAQFRRSGQTTGYKAMRLSLESEDDSHLTSKQMVKRMAYRDTLGPLITGGTGRHLKEKKVLSSRTTAIRVQW